MYRRKCDTANVLIGRQNLSNDVHAILALCLSLPLTQIWLHFHTYSCLPHVVKAYTGRRAVNPLSTGMKQPFTPIHTMQISTYLPAYHTM